MLLLLFSFYIELIFERMGVEKRILIYDNYHQLIIWSRFVETLLTHALLTSFEILRKWSIFVNRTLSLMLTSP